MCIMTAAMTVSGAPTRSVTSSSARTLTSGTAIMIVRLVIWDSAVAACPAPMLATSRRASSCSALRSRTSSMASSYTSAAASRISAGDPSARMVAPPTNGGIPRGASNGSTTMSCCPIRASTTRAARRSPISRMTVGERGGRRPRLVAHQLAQVDRRDHQVAHHQRLPVAHRGHRARVELDRLRHVGQRHRVPLAGDARQQGPDDGEGERHPDDEGGAPARLAPDLDGAAQRPDPGHHHVHADAPARHAAHRLGGAEPRPRQQPEQQVVGERVGVRVDQALAPRLGEDRVPVDAPAVVAQPERDVVPLPAGGQQDAALFRLARRDPLLRAARCRDRRRSGSGAAAAGRSRRGSSGRARSRRPRRRTGSACPGPAPGRAPAGESAPTPRRPGSSARR